MVRIIGLILCVFCTYPLFAVQSKSALNRYSLIGLLVANNKDTNSVAVIWDNQLKRSYTMVAGAMIDHSANHSVKAIRPGEVELDLNGATMVLSRMLDEAAPYKQVYESEITQQRTKDTSVDWIKEIPKAKIPDKNEVKAHVESFDLGDMSDYVPDEEEDD